MLQQTSYLLHIMTVLGTLPKVTGTYLDILYITVAYGIYTHGTYGQTAVTDH